MTILLKDIWHIANTDDYKIHFARNNKSVEPTNAEEPLNVWVRSPAEWEDWQKYRPHNNAFNRTYIFSLMNFHHEYDTWLFGGVFEVLERSDRKFEHSYKVKLTDIGEEFIGRLKIKLPYTAQQSRPKMECYYDAFKVKEILSEPYTGQTFPGYEEIDLSFGELRSLIKNDRLDWKTALENVKGIYLLTDTKTNKKYVGAAFGNSGMWSRWGNYINTGHGGNVEIRKLVKKGGIDYCKKHFRFALLENRPFNTSDEKIRSRETYWKEILRTGKGKGLNRN